MLALADQLLARQEFEDWVQIIIVVLVLAGSAIGGLSKKLMEVFGEHRADKTEEPDEKLRRRRPSLYPPAQPMPQRGASPAPITTVGGETMTARPLASVPQTPSAPPVVARIGGIEVVIHRPAPPGSADRPAPMSPAPAKPMRSSRPVVPMPPRRTATPSVRRVSSIRPVRRPVPTEPTRSKPPLPPMPKQATDRLGAYESAEEQHLGHLEPTVSRHATQFDAGVQQHLGVLRPRVGASAAVLTPGVSLVGGDISTPAGLRQAVILSELLAPPLALRPPDQHS